MNETWRPVVGYEGLYSVSDHGRIRSERRIPNKILQPSKIDKNNRYPRVTLWRNGYYSVRRVHHIVLEAFVGPIPNGLETLHNDDNPENNKLSNLHYDTHQINILQRDKKARSHQLQ